jgi:hypothetical protein
VRDRKKRWLKLHQGDYTLKLLEEYQMADCNPTDTPITPDNGKTGWIMAKQDEGEKYVKEVIKLFSPHGWCLFSFPTSPIDLGPPRTSLTCL